MQGGGGGVFGLEPCWKLWEGMFVVMCGSSIFSSVFAMGERSAIGL